MVVGNLVDIAVKKVHRLYWQYRKNPAEFRKRAGHLIRKVREIDAYAEKKKQS